MWYQTEYEVSTEPRMKLDFLDIVRKLNTVTPFSNALFSKFCPQLAQDKEIR